MEENFNTLAFGRHSVLFHTLGLVFALFGSLVIKRVYYLIDKKTSLAAGYAFPKFSINRWFRENWIDVSLSLVTCFILVRFLSFVFRLMAENDISIFGYKIPETNDQLVFYVVFAVVIQIFAHKWLKPIRNKK